MNFTTFASHMYPFWILGIIIMGSIIAIGHKHLLRAEKKPIIKWVRFLFYITLWRLFMSKLLNFHGVSDPQNIVLLPIATALTVFWEDACHGLPLLILKKSTKNRWWTKPIYWLALIIVMIEFGLGHRYQGPLAAVLLSFYIPYSVKMGEKYGFGTVMLCHMMYDLVTLLFTHYMIHW